MKDWQQYSQTKTTTNALTGGKPNVWEYTWIKFVDKITERPLVAFMGVLVPFFFIFGAYLSYKKVDCSSLILDAGKLSLGVLLGTLSQKGKAR